MQSAVSSVWQTELTGLCMERETLIRNVKHYRVRVQNMVDDCKRTVVTVSAVSKDVNELEKEKGGVETSNLSIYKQKDEMVMKRMDAYRTAKAEPRKARLWCPFLLCTMFLAWK